MDLKYATNSMIELGLLDYISIDCAVGSENNFELVQDLSTHSLESSFFIYVNDTEFGGIVDTSVPETVTDSVTFRGRTWHGILEGKKLYNFNGVIEYTGKLSQIGQQIINEYGLNTLFHVDLNDTSNVITKSFENFTDVYSALKQIAEENGYKVKIRFNEDDKKVNLSFEEIVDYSQKDEWDNYLYNFKVTKVHNFVNHYIGLSVDEEKNTRIECHLYADRNGNISDVQSIFGINEITETVLTNAKTFDELKEDCEKNFLDLLNIQSIETTFDEGDESKKYDIGDIVGAVNPLDGVLISQYVTKKILKIQNGIESIEVEVGNNV